MPYGRWPEEEVKVDSTVLGRDERRRDQVWMRADALERSHTREHGRERVQAVVSGGGRSVSHNTFQGQTRVVGDEALKHCHN